MTGPSTPPYSFISKVKSAAPTRTLSENWGRTGGYYGDEDSCTRAYAAVLVYIELGMSRHPGLLESIRRLIDSVQPTEVRYLLIPMAYGDDGDLKHDSRPITVQGGLRFRSEGLFFETCRRLADVDPVDTPCVPSLFPRTDIRSLYTGKVSVDAKDLLIFASSTPIPAFTDAVAASVDRHRKRSIVVTPDGDGFAWSFLPTSSLP